MQRAGLLLALAAVGSALSGCGLQPVYSGGGTATHYLSFKTPVGVPMEQQCGKVVYAGLHVSSSSSVGASFPSGCSTTFTPDEKALAFLLFDLGSCVDVIF